MAIALAVALCLASGFALVSIGWRRFNPRWIDLLLRGSLAIGFGIGIFSCIFFLGRVFGITHFLIVDSSIFGVLVIILLISGRHRNEECNALERRTPRPSDEGAGGSKILLLASCFALGAAAYAAVMHTLAHPQGDGWDSFAIWNLRARFLFRGGNEHWRDGFSQLLPWSHPDYPLLLPASIAHFWTCLGREAVAVPALIGLAFTFCTVGLMFSSVAILRGRIHAMLPTILLLATPAFIQQGTSQYADVPLSFFLLCAVALLALRRETGSSLRGLLVLAGISAGFAGWTKNEGLLFAEALIVANLFDLVRGKYSGATARNFILLLAGLSPLLMLIFYYKHWIAGPGDLFSTSTVMLARVEQPARYRIVLQWFAKDFLRFGAWFVVPGTVLLLLFYFLANRGTRRTHAFAHSPTVLALVLTLAGYFGVYLITPHDLYWHLRFSLDRLFLQLWPSTIFLVFLAIRSPLAFGVVGVSK